MIPVELGHLSNLRVLSVWDNELTGELITHRYEGFVVLASKKFGLFLGSIPVELGQLFNLREIHLSMNQLTG